MLHNRWFVRVFLPCDLQRGFVVSLSAYLIPITQIDVCLSVFSLQVHARSFCEGVNKRTGPLTCFQPSFACMSPFTLFALRRLTPFPVSAAKWFTTANSKRDEEASPDHANCWRPDLITIIDDDGQEVKIKVPNGMNTEFEQAFVKGNFTRLFKLARISPDLRFAFSTAGL